jgi:hypothetical protein
MLIPPAIKTADLLLKKNPNHGETEAMKALTLNAMGNSEEGMRLALFPDIPCTALSIPLFHAVIKSPG